MNFPELSPHVWRTDRPFIVTLVDGDRMPAYPVIGKVEDETFYFGDACQEKMWLVPDRMIESPLITECGQSRIIEAGKVVNWEPILPAGPAQQLSVNAETPSDV